MHIHGLGLLEKLRVGRRDHVSGPETFQPPTRGCGINNPGTRATSNHDLGRVAWLSNQHGVSVRSRNRVLCRGDSSEEVIRSMAASPAMTPGAGLRTARLGARRARRMNRFGGISARILRAGLHHAARASRGNHTFGAPTNEVVTAALFARAVSGGTGPRPGGSHRLRAHPRPTGYPTKRPLIGLGAALVERFLAVRCAAHHGHKLVTLPGGGAQKPPMAI